MAKRTIEIETASGEAGSFLTPNPWYSVEGNIISNLVTPKMRRQIRELILQLNRCDYCLPELLTNIRVAREIAQKSAECLLTSDPFEAWEKIREDELDALLDRSAAKNPTKAKVQKLITPQMRQQIVEATKRIEDYASCLGKFFDDFNKLKSFHAAIKMADDLRQRRPLETREMRKKREAEEAEQVDFWD